MQSSPMNLPPAGADLGMDPFELLLASLGA